MPGCSKSWNHPARLSIYRGMPNAVRIPAAALWSRREKYRTGADVGAVWSGVLPCFRDLSACRSTSQHQSQHQSWGVVTPTARAPQVGSATRRFRKKPFLAQTSICDIFRLPLCVSKDESEKKISLFPNTVMNCLCMSNRLLKNKTNASHQVT